MPSKLPLGIYMTNRDAEQQTSLLPRSTALTLKSPSAVGFNSLVWS